jgi:branched-chain amino acid transport system ATP-binding protein
MTMTIPRVEVRNVSVAFGGVRAVSDVDLAVPAGSIHGLIGPNGAGKTTLFDVISGIRPPTAGRVLLDGRDVTDLRPMKRARIGLRRTFQRQQPFTWLSVRDNVLAALEWRTGRLGLGGELLRLPPARRLERERIERVDALLDEFGLTPLRDHPVGNLPIGRVRLVELARALVDQPRLLLLDEPTSGLTPGEADLVGEVLTAYLTRADCTVLIVEHDIEFVLGLCTRLTVLEAGLVIFEGTASEARSDAQVRRAYLG